jgi:glycosyltransferase involved in cell wall biosynthesis
MVRTQDIIPLVSVIVVTYNQSLYIRQCLDSILGQKTSFTFEIILGEDHSTDNTREICEAYAAAHPEIISLRLQKREDVIFIDGYPTGRFNIIDCMPHARGEYIAFCEGDDYWLSEDKLQKQVEVMLSNPSCAGSFHATRIAIGLEETQTLFRHDLPTSLGFTDTIARTSPFHTTSFFTRTKFLQLPPFASSVTSFDMMLFALAANNGTLISVPEVYSVYRKHGEGITSNPALKTNYHRRRILLFFNRDLQHFDDIIAYHRSEMPMPVEEKSIIQKIKEKLARLIS